MQAPDRARYRRRIPHRSFEQHIGGIGVDLGASRAHHTAYRGDGDIIDDEHIAGVERAFDAVEGHHLLPRVGETHRKLTVDPAAVMSVHGVAEFEHDVVGDVDRRRDGPDTREDETTTQPPRRHCGPIDTGNRAQCETAHAGSGLDRHRQCVTLGRQYRHHVGVEGGVDKFEVVGTRDLAGDTAHRQAVPAVGCDGQIEDHIIEAQHRDRVVAGLGRPGRQHQDAGVIGPHAQFGSRADHAVGGPAVGRAGGDLEITRQRGTGQCHRNQISDREVRCAADDIAVATLADIHRAGPDGLLELGEFLDRGHPTDLQRSADRAEGDHILDLVADPDQRLLEFSRRYVPSGCAGPHDLAQPAVREPHQTPAPNGSENRTSPSTMSRISGIPLRNCRVRSRPMPKANPE